jgi:hypothetical protein
VQIDTNQASSSGSLNEDQGQASGNNQISILQPTRIARDHPLEQVIRSKERRVGKACKV